VAENGGHECLVVEAFVPNFDPLTAPMDPALDRHVGQKNEQLIIVQQGQDFSIKLQTANIAPVAQQVTIELHSYREKTIPLFLNVRGENELVRAQQKLRSPTPPTSDIPLAVLLEDRSGSFVPSSDFYARRLLSADTAEAARGDAALFYAPWISKSVDMDAWESRALRISGVIPDDAPAGQTFVFRVVQRVGRIVTGGYTVSVLVADSRKA
jgi:hypothetical protein